MKSSNNVQMNKIVVDSNTFEYPKVLEYKSLYKYNDVELFLKYSSTRLCEGCYFYKNKILCHNGFEKLQENGVICQETWLNGNEIRNFIFVTKQEYLIYKESFKMKTEREKYIGYIKEYSEELGLEEPDYEKMSLNELSIMADGLLEILDK